MAYIGNTVQNQGFAPAIDYFSGNGVTVTFTLSRNVASAAQMIVTVDNVIQNPASAYTVSGNAISFTSAPLSGTNNIWVEYTSLITTYAAISQSPSVIGDLTASGGYLSTGSFNNSFLDGTIVDYVTGNGRITVGAADGLTIYNGGTSARTALATWTQAGYMGLGTTSPTTIFQANTTVPTTWSTNDSSGYTVTPYPNELAIINNQNATTNSFSGIFFQGGQLSSNTQIHSARIGVLNDGTTYGGAMAFATRNGSNGNMVESMRIDSSGNAMVATTGALGKMTVAGTGYYGNGINGNSTGTSGGAYFYQSNWDTAGTTHTIAYGSATGYTQYDNAAGFLIVSASNKSNTGKAGAILIAWAKGRSDGIYITTVSTQKSSALTTLTASTSGNNIVITTDSDCYITFNVLGGV